MNWETTSLKILNLNTTEIAILNALNEAKSVQGIAKVSKLSRTGINHALNGLYNKKLVKYELFGKRRLFKALTLEELTLKLKKTIEEIELTKNNKKGTKVKISKEDEFIIHVGTKEIIPAYKRIAAENKNERIRAIQHHRSWIQLINKMTSEQVTEFNDAVKKNHLIIDGILNRGAYEDYKKEIKENPEKNIEAVKSLEGRMADYTLFDDEYFNYDAEIWLFKTTTLIITWKEEVAIEIINANMTGFLKDMFEFVKKDGQKFDHNKAIKGVL